MNIGFISTRLAGVDGVSLETAKLAKVLEDTGHRCFYCAGELEASLTGKRLVPRMHFQDPEIQAINWQAFQGAGDPALFQRIYSLADELRHEIEAFAGEFNVDLIISQNSSTIPMNLPLGVAINDFVIRNRIPAICHHHDFFWERERFLSSSVSDILDSVFPPRGELFHHFTINTIMQRRVRAWYGIDSVYLPNVFDFENPPPPMDDYARSFRRELGLNDDDLIVLQPTRVIRRKAIEKGIELLRKLDDPRLIYLITGYEGDEPGGYGDWLREEADRAGIRYRFIADYVGAQRGEQNGHRVYSLWDIYPHAHFITYPSVYEGFGNALVETIYFRKPFIAHTFPVYLADIKGVGVQAVEFYHDITPAVLDATRCLIDDAAFRQDMVEHNYAVCLEHFSYRVLRARLSAMLERIAG